MIRRLHQVLRWSVGIVAVSAALSAAPLLSIPASAATQYVGMVVQTGPKAKAAVSCVPWAKGMSGFDVLRSAEHDIAWQAKTYKVLQIDLVPEAATADATHYWAYYHRAAGNRWQRSATNGAAYQPQPGTVEGWIYVNGKAYSPPDLTYTSICARPSATPTPSARASSSAPRTTASHTTLAPPRATTHVTPKAPASGNVGAHPKPSATRRTSAARPATPASTKVAADTGPRHPPASGAVLWTALGGLVLICGVAAGTVVLMNRRGGPS